MFIDSQSLQIKSTILVVGVGGERVKEGVKILYCNLSYVYLNTCRCVYEEAEKEVISEECFPQVSGSETGGAAGHTKGPRATGGQNTRSRTLRKQRV